MINKVSKNTNDIVDFYINIFKNENIVAVDMTLGNGNDLYKVAKNVDIKSKLYGFDISSVAIENSKKKLEEFDNISLIHDSHENILNYVDENINLAIYNLGYLPKGDKSITTESNVVLKSLKIVMDKLNINGIILITFYPGHKSGLKESIELESFLKEVNQKKFTILKFDFINQINNPPYTIAIERVN